MRETIDRLDKAVSYWIFSGAQKFMPRIKPTLIGLEWSGNGIIWLSVTILLILFDQDPSAMAPKLLIGLIVDIIHVATIKASARRRRPTYAYQRDQLIVANVDKHSFPSGHCSRATYIALLVSLYFHQSFVSLLAILWTVSVCVSRVLLGRHHVLDCVAGALLGWMIYFVQFQTPIPVNYIGMFFIRSLFGLKGSNDPNDIDGVDAFH